MVGDGLCHPEGCLSSNNSCKTNGYFKDGSSYGECLATCLHDKGCIGFAISGDKASTLEPMKPNRCFVYGRIWDKPFEWTKYSQEHFDVYTISSQQADTMCVKIGNS